MLATPGSIQADEPNPAPTPVDTVVTPVVVTVVPVHQVVTPITGMAEAETTGVEQSPPGDSGSSSPFGGVRGGLIGAGIAVGMALAATVAIRGAKRALTRGR
jgi:hypothetical protein